MRAQQQHQPQHEANNDHCRQPAQLARHDRQHQLHSWLARPQRLLISSSATATATFTAATITTAGSLVARPFLAKAAQTAATGTLGEVSLL